MRYLVLGAGAIGGYFGGMLLRGGADLSFLVRPKRAARLAERGLVVKAPGGNVECPVRTMLSGEVDGHYDVVLLACKTYDLDSAMEAIAPAVGSDSVILPFQNGINHISILVDRFAYQCSAERRLRIVGFRLRGISSDGPAVPTRRLSAS